MKPKKGQFRFKKAIKVSTYKNGDGLTNVEANHLGKNIGTMSLEAPFKGSEREVAEIVVDKKYRRQGVATSMWKHAKDVGLNPKHSETQSPAGRAWAKKVGD
jgi:ribosomal protein S18 acetylase RimI-like enzyme